MRRFSTRAMALLSISMASAAGAEDSFPFPASEGKDLARAAASAWADDARLIYVENDTAVGADGRAVRWGYLFHSEKSGVARGYSIENGKIEVAEDLGFDFPAPPLSGHWIDSGEALRSADEKAGHHFRAAHDGTVRAMLLARGLLDPEDPDATAWAVVYDSPTAPALWVVVNARSGKVVRTWRG